MSDDIPRLAGVIGWPIGHSRSPRLHSHWIAQHGINGHYVPIPLAPENLEEGIRALPKLGFRGANVTIPYKENVLLIANNVSDRAALIGAANTLIISEGGKILADNTDAYGFLSNIRQYEPSWSASEGPALVLGAGGASRAVVSALLEDGAPEVRITNRTRHRAENLRDQFGAKITVVAWDQKTDAMSGISTLVNTTSLGMVGQPPLSIRISAAPRSALVTDLVYAPLQTDLLADARARGMRVVDGLGMLLHQAVPGFHAWFDTRPVVDDELRRVVLAE